MAVAIKVSENLHRDYSDIDTLSLSFRRSISHFRCRNVSFHRLQPLPCRFEARAVKRSPKRLKYATPYFSKDGGVLYVEVDPSGIDSWKLDPVIEQLKEGAVGVIPTDTVYAALHLLVCSTRAMAH